MALDVAQLIPADMHGTHIARKRPGCRLLEWVDPTPRFARVRARGRTCALCSTTVYELREGGGLAYIARVRIDDEGEPFRVDITRPLRPGRTALLWQELLSGMAR